MILHETLNSILSLDNVWAIKCLKQQHENILLHIAAVVERMLRAKHRKKVSQFAICTQKFNGTFLNFKSGKQRY